MDMPQTQDKIGPQEVAETNDVQKSGRPLPPGQPKIGVQVVDEGNPKEQPGSIPPDIRKRGTQESTPAGSAKPRRANDHVKPAKGASY